MSRFALLVAALALLTSPVSAQMLDADAAPRQGTLQLSSGTADALDLTISTPDEHPGDCPGFLDTSAPDAVVDWSGASAMRLWVRSSADATLTVIGPDGEMRCEDDVDGVQPAILYDQPTAGRYAVWVGSFGVDDMEGAAATLYAGPPPPPPTLGTGASADLIVFDGGDDAAIDVDAGGAFPAEALGMPDYCVGFYHEEASARVSGPTPYTVRANSGAADLTLAVRTRGGGWICNDDASGFLDTNPAVEVQAAGEHTIWVGTFRGYARGESPLATLVVTTEGPVSPPLPPGPDGPRQRFGEATYTVLDVDAPGETLELSAGVDSTSATYDLGELVQNPVTGDFCRGYIAPSRTLTLMAEGDGPITLYATGDDDLVLVARDGDGQWFCSDDATGRDPAIEVEAGEIAVWIGTFSTLSQASASFSAIRGNIDDVLPEENFGTDFDLGDPAFGLASYSEGMYEGDEIGGEPQTRVMLTGSSAEEPVLAGGDLFMPVEGDACTGYITPTPTASISFAADTVSFTAVPDQGEDLTMLVQTPDGRWFCSDDYDGRAPGIEVSGAGDGTYTIWVGTFDALETPVGALLTVSEGSLSDIE